jgi:hypothetical protein
MEQPNQIHLSDGTQYTAVLTVYRDYLRSNGQWALFWQNPDNDCGVHEQSTVTGQPFFRTMRAAIRHGERDATRSQPSVVTVMRKISVSGNRLTARVSKSASKAASKSATN